MRQASFGCLALKNQHEGKQKPFTVFIFGYSSSVCVCVLAVCLIWKSVLQIEQKTSTKRRFRYDDFELWITCLESSDFLRTIDPHFSSCTGMIKIKNHGTNALHFFLVFLFCSVWQCIQVLVCLFAIIVCASASALWPSYYSAYKWPAYGKMHISRLFVCGSHAHCLQSAEVSRTKPFFWQNSIHFEIENYFFLQNYLKIEWKL